MRVLLATALLSVGVNASWALDVDPTLVTSVSYSSADTPLYDADATSWVTNQGTFGGGGYNKSNTQMAFIKFNVTSELSGKLIRSAQLCFHSVCNDATKNSTVYAAVMSTNWDETATWNNSNKSEVLSPRTGVGSFSVDDSGADLTYDVTSVLRADDDNVIAFLIYTGTTRSQTISNIKLVLDLADAATNAYYTVKYEDEDGTAVKSSVQRVGEKDGSITLLDSDKETFFTAGNAKKYTYVSDDSGEKTVASDGTTEFTVVFHDNLYCSYTIQSSLGNIFAEGEDWEGTVINYAYPRYYNVDGTLYQAAANGNAYTNSITLNSANQEQIVNYSATAITNVYFYSEAEDLVTSSYHVTAGTLSSTGSGGKGAASAGNKISDAPVSIVTLPAGKYKVTARLGGKKNGGHRVKAGETIVLNVSSTAGEENNLTNGYLAEITSSDFTLASETAMTYEGGYVTTTAGNAQGLDYIYFTKSAVSYTIEYKCGSTTIKDADASRTAVWGTTVTLPSTDKVDIIYGGKLYRYTSDDASSQVIASDGTTVITANFEDMGTIQTITYTLNVGSSASTTIKSSTSTTDGTNITGIDIDQSKAAGDGSGSGTDRTTKLPIKTGANGDTFDSPTDYVLFKYTIAAGKKFTPVNIAIKVANVGSSSANDIKYKATLSDATNSISGTYIVKTQDGTVEDFVITNGENTSFTGNVTLKLWAWQIGTSNASAFRMGTPLTISGVVDYSDEVTNAIADCKTYETSATFATHIDGLLAAGSLTTAAEVYSAHTAWQIDNAADNDITGVIRNAAVADATDWDGAVILNGEQYTGAPDAYYIDRNGANIWATQWIYGLPAGKYQVKVASRANADTYSHIYVSYNGEYDICTARGTHVGNTGGDLGNGWSWTYVPFEITETTNILLGFYAATTGGWASCDDWHLYKVTDDYPVEITSAGWATLFAPYALNFEGTGLTAYTATCDGSTVTLTQVNNVPARTGVVLKGAADNYDIPLAASSSTAQGDLKGSPNWPTAWNAEAGYTYYILTMNGENAEFNPVTSGEIPAGKAFLRVASGEARTLKVVFADDETAGINSIENSPMSIGGAFYNLNGQRVAQPTKGLYIINGKKVVIK